MLPMDYHHKGSVAKKILGPESQGSGAKEKWLTVNPQSSSNFDFDFELLTEAVIRVGGWREMVASLRGREPGNNFYLQNFSQITES
jgi:hypothetical protein